MLFRVFEFTVVLVNMKHIHCTLFLKAFTNNSEITHCLAQYFAYETTYSRMDQVKFFKGCLPQILFGPFLSHLRNTPPGKSCFGDSATQKDTGADPKILIWLNVVYFIIIPP